MLRLWTSASVLASILVVLPTSLMAQEIQFRWKLTPGLKLESQVTQDIEQSPPGSTKPVTQKMELTQLWEVGNRLPDGSAEIVTKLLRAKMSMDIPGAGNVDIDTDKKEAPTGFGKQLMDMFRPMVGVACTNKMLPTGKISDVVIPAEALTGFKSMPMGASMEPMLKDSIEKGSPVFPDKAIARGESWTQVTEAKTQIGTLVSNNQYTYVGPVVVDGMNLHQFDIQTTMQFQGANAFNAKVTVGEQDIRGRLLFDNERGYLAISELNQKMTMDIEVAGQPKISQKLQQTMRSTFKPQTK